MIRIMNSASTSSSFSMLFIIKFQARVFLKPYGQRISWSLPGDKISPYMKLTLWSIYHDEQESNGLNLLIHTYKNTSEFSPLLNFSQNYYRARVDAQRRSLNRQNSYLWYYNYEQYLTKVLCNFEQVIIEVYQG